MSVLPRLRVIDPGRAYWFVMLAASICGANLGDFAVDDLGLGRLASFALLAGICAAAIWLDRVFGSRTEAPYWVAVVALRAAATNMGDVFTHDWALGYVLSAMVLAGLTAIAASLTRASPGRKAPSPDARYWIAMLLAGLFGTVGGDLVSHSVGLYASSTILTAILVVAIAVRSAPGMGGVALYWVVVCAERCAGTALGDTLASRRALALGLPLSVAGSFLVLLALLALRTMLRQRRPIVATL